MYKWHGELLVATAWEGHMSWATEFVKKIKPKVIVELGVYGGHSLLSFAQGVKDLELKTKIYGIDTWIGDLNMGEYQGDDVLRGLQATIDNHFKDIPIKLIRRDFHKARNIFKKESVDILHIDGQHNYPSVVRDLNDYVGKVKVGGYILMHDTQVFDTGFDVNRVFGELKTNYPGWEFEERMESFGLGIIKKTSQSSDIVLKGSE